MPPTATGWSDGERRILIRPDPQVVWKTPRQSPLWAKADAVYHRSNQGGGEWEYQPPAARKVEDPAAAKGDDRLTLIVSPTGFKHTGVFPEQAVNWAWYAAEDPRRRTPGEGAEPVRLHRRCHAGLRRGRVPPSAMWTPPRASWPGARTTLWPAAWPTGPSAGWWTTVPSSWRREKRRGNTYDGIIMDPPSYGRGPGGEIWKLEDCIYDLISQCEEVLSDKPLFFAVNSYTTGLSPAVMEYMLKTTLVPRFGGQDQLRRDRPAGVRHRRRGALRCHGHLGRINKPKRLKWPPLCSGHISAESRFLILTFVSGLRAAPNAFSREGPPLQAAFLKK